MFGLIANPGTTGRTVPNVRGVRMTGCGLAGGGGGKADPVGTTGPPGEGEANLFTWFISEMAGLTR